MIGDWTTLLFVPGDRPDRFAKAAAAGADAVVVDLEDAVAEAAKDQARANLAGLDLAAPALVRINGLGTAWGERDLAAAPPSLAAVMLPKAETAADVERAHELTGKPVVALVETAAGIGRAREIASARGVARLAFGSLDFASDLGAAHTRETLLLARSELCLASRIAGLPAPIDGVTPEIDQAAKVEDDARYAASLGFGAKLCIHPAQLAPARLGFAPTAEQIAWARKILDSPGDGAVRLGSTMVDAPVRLRAEAILRQARGAGLAG